METRKIIDAIDDIKDARGEAALALQLIRWYLVQLLHPPVGGTEGGFLSGTEGNLWTSLLRFAQKQALVGVMFEGIKRLPKEFAPKGRVLLEWVAQSEAIRRQNIRLDRATADVYNMVRARGYGCCILKGQGNALMYDAPSSRTPGDVDVWLVGKMKRLKDGKTEGFPSCGQAESGRQAGNIERPITRKELRGLAAGLAKDGGSVGEESYNHIAMTVGGIPVELHPTPAVLCNPVHNRRLQRWLRRNAERQCSNLVDLPDGAGSVAVPTAAFNAVYQLHHLYHHHFFEGIGLRQFVDYLLVLRNAGLSECPSEESAVLSECPSAENMVLSERSSATKAVLPEERRKAFARDLKHLGLYKFAGAVMYVLHEVFGLPKEELPVPMDKRRGSLLLADILRGGNFGHYDTRFAKSALGHNLQRLHRDLQLLRYYPSEAIAEPFFRLWHWAWRRLHAG